MCSRFIKPANRVEKTPTEADMARLIVLAYSARAYQYQH